MTSTTTTYALIVAAWVAGFAFGYLVRSYVSYRRRLRARRSAYTIPGTHTRFTLMQNREEGAPALVPPDTPAHGEGSAARSPQSVPTEIGEGALLH